MKKILFILFASIPFISYCQDSALTYSRILNFDSLTKDQIYDKALIWCGKRFVNSNYAIKVQERSGGILGGKAYYESNYKIPYKKDSVYAIDRYVIAFHKYYFDWLIEIKDNKLRLSITNIETEDIRSDNAKLPVYINSHAPYQFMFQAKAKSELYWMLSNQYLIYNFDGFVTSLNKDIQTGRNQW